MRAMFGLYGLCSGYVRRRPHSQQGLEVAERKAMCGILLGNAAAEC